MPDLPSRARDRLRHQGWSVLALFFALQCSVVTVAVVSRQRPFSEYLHQARRCVERNECPSVGGRTGALPLFHGHSWIRLLSYSLRDGRDLTALQPIVAGLFILSLLPAFVLLDRRLGRRAAALTLGLYGPVVLACSDVTTLTYNNLLALPFALYYAALAVFVETRRIAPSAVASAALAAAVSAELGNIVMLPFHYLMIVLIAQARLAAVAICALSFAIPFWLDSRDAALEIVRQMPSVRFAAGLAISGAGLFVAARRIAPHLAAPAAERVSTVMTAAFVYVIAAIWLASVFLMGGVPAPRYLAAASFPFLFRAGQRLSTAGPQASRDLAVVEGLTLLLIPLAPHAMDLLSVLVAAVFTLAVAGMLLSRFLSRRTGPLWAPLAICLGAAAFALAGVAVSAKRGEMQRLTLGEAERLVTTLYAAGYRYGELLGAVHGPAADDLMPLLSERDPHLFDGPARLETPAFGLLIVKVPQAGVARTHGLVAAVPIDSSRSAVIVRGARYLDWTRMRMCAWSGAVYECREPRTGGPLRRNWPYVELGSPLASSAPAGAGSRRAVRYVVPVRTPGRGEPHIVRTTNEWPATWQIVGVSGVDFEGTLPAREIRVLDTRESTGALELEMVPLLVSGDLPWMWLPHVIEVAQRNEHLLESFRQS